MATIHEICSAIYQVNPATGKTSPRNPKRITDGLTPASVRRVRHEGIYTLTVEEILSVEVERLSVVDGEIVGYQRDENNFVLGHARAIGRAITKGRSIAPPTLALDNGKLYAPDGQHRLVGTVIAGEPMRVVVEQLDEQERKDRFADQSLAKRPGQEVLILGRADSDPFAAYIKAAIEADIQGVHHNLGDYVAMRASKTRLGVPTVYDWIAGYCLGAHRHDHHRMLLELTPDEFRKRTDPHLMDEAAKLLTAFGPKKDVHPRFGYLPATVRALRDVAVQGVRREVEQHDKAVTRWIRLMPKMKWDAMPIQVTRRNDVRHELAKRWNSHRPDGFPFVDF